MLLYMLEYEARHDGFTINQVTLDGEKTRVADLTVENNYLYPDEVATILQPLLELLMTKRSPFRV